MEEKNNQDFFHNFKSLNSHFHEAFEAKEAEDALFYNEISNSHERYQNDTAIDHGGMKKVSRCLDRFTLRDVAVAKLLDADNVDNIDRFIKEARLTASLQHPNIMPVYDMGLDDEGQPFFTMKLFQGLPMDEWYESESLKEGVKDHDIVQIMIKVCQAISYAHANGIVHLDLKPANIGVGAYGEVMIFDWGIAKILDENNESPSLSLLDPEVYNDATLNGVVKGSPGYLAPEQIDPIFGDKNETTDVYALGGILYYMLCGLKPIECKDTMESLEKTLRGEVIKPSKFKDDYVSISLEAVAMKALSLKQKDRYQSVDDFLKDISKWLNGFATDAEKAGFATSLLLLMKRHRDITAILIVFMFFAIYGVVQIMVSEKRALKNEQEALHALELYKNEKEQTRIIGKEAAPRLATLTEEEFNQQYAYDFDKALELANRTVLRDPDLVEGWLVKSKVHFSRQEFNQVLEAMKNVPSKLRASVKIYQLSQYYALQKDDSELLQINKLNELMKELNHVQLSYLLAGYAEQHTKVLEDRVAIASALLKLTNRHAAPNLKMSIKYLKNDFLDVNLSDNPKLYSLSGLRNLPIKIMDISNSGISIALDLKIMPITELRMKNTNIRNLNEVLKLRYLKKLVIGKSDFIDFKGKIPAHISLIRE
ncbi:serine/threonine-protein kinase [Lentisphaera profundi]|uniref:Serine/threonine-protein kinase n=1 Tax=Lentisphaera profundi TaxID=1658616 RepID=A0ABY7VRG1_9BACT|nr:serine/threonine-protein kinase [Lentisphaera profundi]WDE95472.1 serine/threonine-protein kinase [Lentisphaera profundi]